MKAEQLIIKNRAPILVAGRIGVNKDEIQMVF